MIATPDEHDERDVVRRALLLSLRPRFAAAILDGTKTVELRRTRLAAPLGTALVLYASSPIMAVVGTATLAERHTASPSAIWRAHRHALGLTYGEFTEYLAGVDQATALTIERPQALPDPFTLAWLRRHAGFRPPQSYRYIAPSDPTPLRDLASAQGHGRSEAAEFHPGWHSRPTGCSINDGLQSMPDSPDTTNLQRQQHLITGRNPRV